MFVQSPDRLIGHLDHRSALFGRFPVGESIFHQVYYTRRSLCNGELPGTPDSIQKQGYFLLVDRGGCSFAEKVLSAQTENATAVFIADNKCLCSFEDQCESDLECQDSEPTMDDDGSGFDITIPSMLLMKPDGDKLKAELVTGTDVEVQLSWPLPKAVNGVTEYTLWMTPDDLLSHQFLMSFMDAAIALGDKAVFRPKMFVSDGTTKGCRRYDDSSDPCPGFCTNYGRYCEPRSYYDFDAYDNKGTKMVVESLRRACIWQVYGDGNGVGEHWWRYVQNWIVSCGSSHYSGSCAESIYEVASIDKDQIESCMDESGNFRKDTSNFLLEMSLDESQSFDVSFAPTMFVNGAVIRGALTFGSALDAICATYEPDDIPDICFQWRQCSARCASGTTCILLGDSCTEYEIPIFSNANAVWDDDYIEYNDDTPETEPPASPQDEDNSDTTDTPIDVPTDPPVSSPASPTTEAPKPSPVFQDNSVLTQAPISSQTDSQFQEPTLAPIAPVFDPTAGGQELPPGPDQELKHEEGGQSVSETIQIYESGRSGSSDIDALAVGLGVGVGVAVCFGCILLFIVLRDRQQMNPYMQPMVMHPNALPMGGNKSMGSVSYYPDQFFRDEHDYSSEDDDYVMGRRSSRRNKGRRKRFFRRSFHKYYDDGDEEERRLFAKSSNRSVGNQNSPSNRSRSTQTAIARGGFVEEDKSVLLRQSMRQGDGELLSIGEEDGRISIDEVEDPLSVAARPENDEDDRSEYRRDRPRRQQYRGERIGGDGENERISRGGRHQQRYEYR